MDLSPITLKQVEWKGRVLIANPPLEFHPYLEAGSPPLIVVDDEDLDLYAYSFLRDQLLVDIADMIFFVWDQLVNDDTGKLTEGARRLAAKYRKRFRLAMNA